jgi:uncharacterized LabA/DUF88 family protein
MPSKLIGMIDAGFLRESGARALRVKLEDLAIEPGAIVDWLDRCARRLNAIHLRCYWYDAAYQTRGPNYTEQRKFFDLIEDTPGMQIRLGSLIERPQPWQSKVRQAAVDSGLEPKEFMSRLGIKKQYEQKGVDTLLVMDMVRLAQQGSYDYAVLVAGDRDLAEAIRTAQEFGRSVFVAAPHNIKVSREVACLSDEMLWLTEPILKRMLLSRD